MRTRRLLERDGPPPRPDRGARSARAAARTPPFRLDNRTGYDTKDLRRFFAKGLIATHTWPGYGDGNWRDMDMSRPAELRIVVVASPIRSRGCAEVGKEVCEEPHCAHTNGSRMVIAIAAPWRFSLRRLARLFEHECAHIRGFEHSAMSRDMLLSLGPTPDWARGATFRYYGSAPAQLPYLRSPRSTNDERSKT